MRNGPGVFPARGKATNNMMLWHRSILLVYYRPAVSTPRAKVCVRCPLDLLRLKGQKDKVKHTVSTKSLQRNR